jgi:hypothetical protein
VAGLQVKLRVLGLVSRPSLEDIDSEIFDSGRVLGFRV